MASKNQITKTSCEETSCEEGIQNIKELEDGIPEWLLIELLTRLPATSICKFKVVSKQFLSLISSHYFQLTYASPHPHLPPWTFISQLHYDACKSHPFPDQQLLMDLHSGGLSCRPISNDQVHDQNASMTSYKVFAVSSSGLVLYRFTVVKYTRDDDRILRYPNYNICNPITKQCIALPQCISGYYNALNWGFLTDVEGGVLKSYTVVVFFPLQSTFEVFSSKTGKWEAHTVSTHLKICNIFLQWTSIDIDGILHWISPIDGIIAYDPQRNPDSFRAIALPIDVDKRRSPEDTFRMGGTYQGCLRYLESAPLSMSVWVLKDYGCGDNWCLQHRVEYRDVNLDRRIRMNIEPISFHPFDSDIIYLGCDTAYVSYNMRTKKMQVLKTFKTPKKKSRRYPWCRAFTLMIPPLPASIPSSLQFSYFHPHSDD